MMTERPASYYYGDYDVVSFPRLGWEFKFSDTALTIAGLEIKWYGIFIALGMLLAMFYCFHRMRKDFGLDPDRVIDAVLAGLVGGLLGARTYYILFSPDKGFDEFFQIRSGGLAIYGGIIGSLLIGCIVAKLRKVKIASLLDVASLGFLIGQGIGRWGNFTNKEAFGSATELPWGMASGSIEAALGVSASSVAQTAHPCFLYESLWCALGFVLLHIYSKRRKFDGEIFLLYIAWYGFGRFFIEGLRMDSLYIGKLRVSQMLAAVCVIVAVILILILRGHYKRAATPLYRDTEASRLLLREADDRIKAYAEKQAEKKAKKAQKAEERAEQSQKDADKAASQAEKARKEAQQAMKQAEKVQEKLSDANSQAAPVTDEKQTEEENHGKDH